MLQDALSNMMIRLLMLSPSIKFRMKRWTKQMTMPTHSHGQKKGTHMNENDGKRNEANDHVKVIFVAHENMQIFR